MIRRILIPSKEIQVIDIRNLCKRRKQLEPTDITKCPSARAIITDQDSNVLADETIPSGETRTIQVNTGGLPPLYTYPYSSLNTGQISSFAVGDDVWVRENVFNPEIASWPIDRPWVTPILDPNSPTKLLFGSNPDGSGNNIFGNKERFTDLVGGQLYNDGLVIDHFTGLMIVIPFVDTGALWESIIEFHHTRIFQGRDDYHAPNANEAYFTQLTGQQGLNFHPLNYAVPTVGNTRLKTSTTYSLATTNNLTYPFINLAIAESKTADRRIGFSFRKAFTYNPVTGQMELT
jgi:hypothetical protein